MAYSRSRTITLLITLTSITSNTFSTLLFHNLPDDPYRLASAFGWYLHFANLLSITGLVGAIRQHALSIAIFSNYLLLDTLLFSIPRFLLLGLLQQLSTSICASTTSAYPNFASHLTTGSFSSSSSSSTSSSLHTTETTTSPSAFDIETIASDWTQQNCVNVVWLIQLTLMAGVIAATLLQFVGALWVRDYARGLWVREWRDEERRLFFEEEEEEENVVGHLRLAGEGKSMGEKS